MSFACVYGSHECSGCMRCQEPDPDYELTVEIGEKAISDGDKKLRAIRELEDRLYGELEELQALYQAAQDEIPAGMETTAEYGSLEHNLCQIDAILDSLLEVEQNIDDMV